MSRSQRIRNRAALLALFTAPLIAPIASAQDSHSPNPALLAGAMGTILLIGLGAYIFIALALQTIAQKTGTPNAWFAWIPIVNIILILNIAKKPVWWIVLFLIPVVNIVISVLVWMAVAEARQKPSWWGLLTLIPLANIIAIAYLAWSD